MTAQANDDSLNLGYPGDNTTQASTPAAPASAPAVVGDPSLSVQPTVTSDITAAALDNQNGSDGRGQQISGPSFDASSSALTEPADIPSASSVPDPAVDPASLVPPVIPPVVPEVAEEPKVEEKPQDEKESPLQVLAKKLAALKSELIEEAPEKEEKVENPEEGKTDGEEAKEETPAEQPTETVQQESLPQDAPVEETPDASNMVEQVSSDIPSTLQTPLPDQTGVDNVQTPINEDNSNQITEQPVSENVPIPDATNIQTEGSVQAPDIMQSPEPSIEEIAKQTVPAPDVLLDPVALGATSQPAATPEIANTEVTQPAIEEQPIEPTTQTQVGTASTTTAAPFETKELELDENDKTTVNLEETVQPTTGKYPLSISKILDAAIERNASDVHVSVGYPVMLRVDGSLIEINEQIVSPANSEELIMPVLSDQKKELLEVNREVDLAYTHRHGGEARFRINAFYTRENLSAAFRLIPTRIKSIEELKLPPIYTQFANLKQGLVLVTGPTGHGKSTTLAAILQHINLNRSVHVLTIEDPIEYIFPKAKAIVDQREMHDDTHSWAVALKSALRQDPDVILVGEMRDFETIAATITLAETGHLVFATLHTNSAAQTIDRIIDVFPENQQAQVRAQLSNILEAVIAQRLIPVEGGGRRAVSEIMLGTPAIRNLIREGKTHQLDNVIRTSADVGMVPLEQSLVKLVREGLITMDKAEEYAVHPEEVVRLLKS